MKQQPQFWYRKPGITATALTPVSWLWQGGSLLRRGLTKPTTPPVATAVVCVGNLTIGGVGKTPLVAALSEVAREAGKIPVILSLGYGGRQRTPHEVQGGDTADMVGDEALELAGVKDNAKHNNIVVVAKPRVAGLGLASRLGDIVIMDDGFQNPSITPSRSVLVFDGGRGVGNGRVIPAGPMRESFAQGIKRASHGVIIGADKTGLSKHITSIAPHIRLTTAKKALTKHAQAVIRKTPVLAFAGIGNPQNFFDLVAAEGGRIKARYPFPDHHPYAQHELARLIETATKQKLTLVTTMKDYMRLPKAFRPHITPLGMRLVIDKSFCRSVLFGA